MSPSLRRWYPSKRWRQRPMSRFGRRNGPSIVKGRHGSGEADDVGFKHGRSRGVPIPITGDERRRMPSYASSSLFLKRAPACRSGISIGPPQARCSANARSACSGATICVAGPRQPVRHESVTHVLGRFRHLCVRGGQYVSGGWGGIRTHGELSPSPVFKTDNKH
jgi:hypothetical protein